MLTSSASSPAAPATLWALVSDVERWPDLLESFTSVGRLGAGPTAVGSRFAVRQPGLPAATWEVTGWEPGRSFTWVTRSPGVTTTATHLVVADGEGSRLDLSLDWSGLLAPVVRPLLRRRTQQMVDHEASTLAARAADPRPDAQA